MSGDKHRRGVHFFMPKLEARSGNIRTAAEAPPPCHLPAPKLTHAHSFLNTAVCVSLYLKGASASSGVCAAAMAANKMQTMFNKKQLKIKRP